MIWIHLVCFNTEEISLFQADFLRIQIIGGMYGTGMGGAMSIISIFMTVFMFALELLVAYIQAYVFTILSSLFIGLAQQEPEHE